MEDRQEKVEVQIVDYWGHERILYVNPSNIDTIINNLQAIKASLPVAPNGDWREWQHEGD